MEDLPFGLARDRSISYQQLRASGLSRPALREALHSELLVRARRDVYLPGDIGPAILEATRVGGRLDCLSALQEHGVFVLENTRTHVQVEPFDGRLRSAHSRHVRLDPKKHRKVVVHWRMLDLPSDQHTTTVIHALAQAARCQPVRATVASIDSALHQGLLDDDGLDELLGMLPARFRTLRSQVDGRAEAGSETLARLLLRSLGCRVEVQKTIDGVGRVDLLVDGWLVIECDSRAHHEGWESQEADRQRDLKLAARGYVCLRPTARMIFESPEVLIDAIRGLLASR